MLRINLLPPYVFDKQKKIKVWAAWIVGIMMCIGIYAFANSIAVHNQEVAQTENDEAHALQKKTQGFDAQKAAVVTRIAETKKKQDFIADAQAWNDEWWKLYSVMRDVTSPKVILRKMYLGSPTMVNIVGWAPSEKEAADWWIQFRNKYTGQGSPFTNVSFELPKNGYPPDPDKTGAAGAPAGAPGGGSVSPRGVSSNSGGFSGGASGGGASSSNDKDDEPGPGYLEDRLGIFFRVHVTLKTPFDNGKTVPVWGAPDTSGAAGAGALALPGGPPAGGGAAPPSGGSADSGDDSGGGKKKKRGGAGGDE